MTLDFDFGNVQTTEFGLGFDDGPVERFELVAVDND